MYYIFTYSCMVIPRRAGTRDGRQGIGSAREREGVDMAQERDEKTPPAKLSLDHPGFATQHYRRPGARPRRLLPLRGEQRLRLNWLYESGASDFEAVVCKKERVDANAQDGEGMFMSSFYRALSEVDDSLTYTSLENWQLPKPLRRVSNRRNRRLGPTSLSCSRSAPNSLAGSPILRQTPHTWSTASSPLRGTFSPTARKAALRESAERLDRPLLFPPIVRSCAA